MTVRIHPLPLGMDRCYVIQGQGTIMIDAGTPGQAANFAKALSRMSIAPQEIQLIVITHGHWDHIGSAGEIQALTGAKIAMHHQEKGWLERPSASSPPPPPGVTAWGRLLVRLLKLFVSSPHITATAVKVVLGDEGLALAEYGIPGRVLHTPGHSSGSVSVLLDSGEAFVGDLAMNGLPLRLGPGLPILAEDLGQVKQSWQLLLDQGAQTVYPAHGKPFPADVMRKALA